MRGAMHSDGQKKFEKKEKDTSE